MPDTPPVVNGNTFPALANGVAVNGQPGGHALAETLQAKHIAPLWKSVVRKTGEGAGVFWKTYIQPHKGKWLAGGLLATYLIMPEKFHDAAGNLTEYAVKQLAELGISVSAGASRGLIQGPVESFKKRYVEEPLTTIFSILLIVALVLLAIPPIRRILWHRVFRRMLRGTHAKNHTASTFPKHEALHE